MTTTLEPGTVQENELLFLEELFADDASCQLNHDLVGLPCSIVVTAIGNSSCGQQVRMCEVARVVATLFMAAGHECLWCDKKAADCWTIVPA